MNYTTLALLKSDYSVNITGIIAQVSIKQTFQNQTNNHIDEGLYVFAVAHNAAVEQMRLTIGQRLIEAEIQEKQQAINTYESAKKQGITASLVQQHRPNLLTTEVANISANEKIEVEIIYLQTLTYDTGHIDFRLPLAIKNRYVVQHKQANMQDTEFPQSNTIDNKHRTIAINLEPGFALSELSSLYHKVDIQDNAVTHSIRLADDILYDNNDFVLRWYPIADNKPEAAMFSEKLNGNEYVLLMLLPAQNKKVMTQLREVVFIIDTSGSMHGGAMSAAKDALYFGLTQLQSQDKFNIIEFNTDTKSLFDISVKANNQNLSQAIDFIDGFKADGGTNMAPALAQAMQNDIEDNYLKQILFVTDGSVGNEAQLFRQISQDIKNARLFTVAIGQAPNNYFMNKAATIGRGTYTNISNLNDVDKSMQELFVKISSPALTDISVDWHTQVEQSPQIIPDLYSDQAVFITAKLAQFERDIVLSGWQQHKLFTKEFQLRQDGDSKGIAKLWARNKIDQLTDDYMLNGEAHNTTLREQITHLGLTYHLVSQFTSLVAVDKNPELSRMLSNQTKQKGQITTLAQVNYPQTALAWKWQFIVSLFLFTIAFLLKRQKKKHEKNSY